MKIDSVEDKSHEEIHIKEDGKLKIYDRYSSTHWNEMTWGDPMEHWGDECEELEALYQAWLQGIEDAKSDLQKFNESSECNQGMG